MDLSQKALELLGERLYCMVMTSAAKLIASTGSTDILCDPQFALATRKLDPNDTGWVGNVAETAEQCVRFIANANRNAHQALNRLA